MAKYSELTIFVREVVNGSMALGAAFVILVFLRYIILNWRKGDITLAAAVAILVLTVGHFIRAFSSWVEFIWFDLKWDASLWMVQSWSWFIISGVLVISGKMLMLIAFSPHRYRMLIVSTAMALCITLPIILALMIPMFEE